MNTPTTVLFQYKPVTVRKSQYEKTTENGGYIKIPLLGSPKEPNLVVGNLKYITKNLYITTNIHKFKNAEGKPYEGELIIEHTPVTNSDINVLVVFPINGTDNKNKENAIIRSVIDEKLGNNFQFDISLNAFSSFEGNHNSSKTVFFVNDPVYFPFLLWEGTGKEPEKSAFKTFNDTNITNNEPSLSFPEFVGSQYKPIRFENIKEPDNLNGAMTETDENNTPIIRGNTVSAVVETFEDGMDSTDNVSFNLSAENLKKGNFGLNEIANTLSYITRPEDEDTSKVKAQHHNFNGKKPVHLNCRPSNYSDPELKKTLMVPMELNSNLDTSAAYSIIIAAIVAIILSIAIIPVYRFSLVDKLKGEGNTVSSLYVFRFMNLYLIFMFLFIFSPLYIYCFLKDDETFTYTGIVVFVFSILVSTILFLYNYFVLYGNKETSEVANDSFSVVFKTFFLKLFLLEGYNKILKGIFTILLGLFLMVKFLFGQYVNMYLLFIVPLSGSLLYGVIQSP